MLFKKSNRLESLIGANSEMNGDMTVQGTLRIDGKFKGNINADWVVLGESGSITGDIQARCAVIGGTAKGNIRADELIEIKHTGQLSGDIYTKKLSVAEGGIFEGHSHIQKDETKVVDFPQKESRLL